jgi:hypothetical protein
MSVGSGAVGLEGGISSEEALSLSRLALGGRWLCEVCFSMSVDEEGEKDIEDEEVEVAWGRL